MTCCLATAFRLDPDGRALCQIADSHGSLGSTGDLVVVDGLLPGESASIRVKRRRRGTREGIVQGPIITSARLAPACPHTARCGGCRTQQLSYLEELRWKQENLQRLFPDIPVEPIEHSPLRFEYRNKMEWTFAQDKAGQRFLGLYGRGVRGVENIEQCALVRPWMNAALQAVRQWWQQTELSAYLPHKNQGTLRTLTLRDGFRTGDRLALLLIHDEEKEKLLPHLPALVASLGALIPNLVLRFQIARTGHPTTFESVVLRGRDYLEEILQVGEQSLRLRISATAFAQPNLFCAEKIYAAALQEVDLSQPLCDLFAGTGTIGLLAAARGCEVSSVEIQPEACADALVNRDLNGCQQWQTVVCQDAGEWLNSQPQAPFQVLVDPPRSGLGPLVCQWLIDHKVSRLIYISCNPKTQRLDCDRFTQNGYRILRARPFDQFPNTPHVEQLVVLERE